MIIVFNQAFAGLRPKRLAAACLGGVTYATALYTVSVVTILLTFGPELTRKMVWPVLQLLKIVRLPLASRMERLFIFLWTGQMYGAVIVLSAVVASGARYLAQSPRIQGLLPVAIGLSVAASGLIQLPITLVMELADWVGRFSPIFMFAIPSILLAASLFRGKGRGQR